jgi:membrane protease YdiL (CAAX protease family)
MIKTRNLFYSKQSRLFSIWRLLRLFLVYGPVIHGFMYLICKLFNVTIPSRYDAFTIVIAVVLTTLYLDKERIESLGIELKMKSLVLFISGILWAYFLCVQIEIVGFCTTNSTFQLVNPFTKSILLSLLYFLFIVGLSEELLFRSYIMRNVGRDTNIVIGIIISAILFTLWHFINGAWSNNPLGLSIASGFIFTLFCGVSFIMTKNIFIAVGFHGAWDVFNQSFHSGNFGFMINFLVILINLIAFYLIFKRRLNFDIKTLKKHWP